MRVGFEVFERVSSTYPLYRGGPAAGTAAEVFPHASACLLAGRLRSRDTPQPEFRRRVLRAAGIRTQGDLPTRDRVDAALAALTGLIALTGEHCAVGDPDEGVILLPVSRLPAGSLAQTRR